ncbi:MULTISPECIES: hypothetical protein [unclassified Salipiger]|uniref:hypothetical protein n=1 Tax=unclassified Salipiger TaxID=2640570 RepID=UPI001F30F605|nr:MULTISPECIES: hypothetical protein [unclassified Salipiger]
MMIRVSAALCALGLLAACAMPPKGTDEQDLMAWDDAVTSIGCELVSESDYQPVELQSGLSRTQVQEIAAYKVKTEEAVPSETGGVRLVTGSCAPAVSAEPVADAETAETAAG